MTVYNGTAGNDVVHGGASADTLNGFGGSDVLYGHQGNDRLNGGDLNDTLYGGAGNDVLYGGMGADNLAGGGGSDTFLFKASDVPTAGAVDVIRDFLKSDQDHINLQGFTNGTLTYDQAQGAFSYDYAGDGRGAVTFLHVDPGKDLHLGQDYFIF